MILMRFENLSGEIILKIKIRFFFFRNEPDGLLNTLCNSFKEDKNVFFSFRRKTSNENFSRFILTFFHRSLLIAFFFFFFCFRSKKKTWKAINNFFNKDFIFRGKISSRRLFVIIRTARYQYLLQLTFRFHH